MSMTDRAPRRARRCAVMSPASRGNSGADHYYFSECFNDRPHLYSITRLFSAMFGRHFRNRLLMHVLAVPSLSAAPVHCTLFPLTE